MYTLPESTKIIIIEDEMNAANILRKLLFDLSYKNINIYNDAESGMEAIRILKPTVVFLDIHLQGSHNGIDILKYIEATKIHSHVIITTAHENHLSDVIKFSPIDFLLKPIGREQLSQAVKKVGYHLFIHAPVDINQNGDNSSELIEINSNHEIRYYKATNVTYLEADGSYTNIYLSSGKKEIVTQNMGKIISNFPEAKFKRISRKHVVNIDYVKLLNKKSRQLHLEINNDTVNITVSPKYMPKKFSS